MDIVTTFEALFLKNRRYGKSPQAVYVWDVEQMNRLLESQRQLVTRPNRRHKQCTVPNLCGVQLVHDKQLRQGQCRIYGPHHQLLDEINILEETQTARALANLPWVMLQAVRSGQQ